MRLVRLGSGHDLSPSLSTFAPGQSPGYERRLPACRGCDSNRRRDEAGAGGDLSASARPSGGRESLTRHSDTIIGYQNTIVKLDIIMVYINITMVI